MSLNPLPLIKGGLSAAGTFLGGIQTYLIVGAVTAALAGSAGAYAGYRWQEGKINALKLADANALTLAIQAKAESDAKQGAIRLRAATTEAYAQGKLEAQVRTILREVPIYVTVKQDAIVCVPVGLARVLRAAADGSDPGALSLAAGQSDDDCSDVTATEMASWFTNYAGASLGNARQLNALQAEIKEQADVAPRGTK